MESNDQLVDYLVEKGFIESERVEKAFRNVDRADFIDEDPYVDRPQRLAEDSTISAPHIVAMMVEKLEPEGKVLEMGSGSGYMLAILNELADEVVGVERIEELVNNSRERLTDVRIIHGFQAPEKDFDSIIYSFATSDDEVRKAKIKTEAEKVIAPIQEASGQKLYLFDNGEKEELSKVRFVSRREGKI
ncbi:MAG: rRNA adenine N-6-methyltransferase family protein [Candidatus Nanohaloarchaea archaeon]